MFTWEKDALNEEQERAIIEKDSILLVACPGSGKTRTLTYKIAYELDRLASSKQFLVAITYTNNAADEIKERIEALGVDTGQLWIGTIHAFCLEWILKPYHLYSERLRHGFKVINSFDSEEIISTLCKAYDKPKVTYYDFQFYACIDGKYRFKAKNENQNAHVRAILREYFRILEENDQIDFEQILFYAFEIIKSKPLICNILAQIFPFILIDEFQDTKDIQYHIIGRILNAGKGASKALIVGDPNQSIFNSLGGFPMPKDRLENLFGFSLKEFGLTRNYRSSELIVKYYDYFKTFPTDIVACGVHKDYESLITYNHSIPLSSLIDEITRLILFNVNERGIDPNEICIVAPQWTHLASLTRKLMIKLPDFSFDGPGMAPFARDIDNFWFKVSRIVLTEPSPNMYVRRLRWSSEVLNELNSAGVDISKLNNKTFLKLCNSILIDEANGLRYLELFFSRICDELGVNLAFYPLLNEHYLSFFESSKSRIKKLIEEGNQFIDEIENFRKVFKQRRGITVCTIHGVKGEEYDTMIGFALLDDYLPHFNDRNGKVNSKKMLYVLASRARKNLHLISERYRGIHDYYAPEGKYPTPNLMEYKYAYSVLPTRPD